MYTLTTTQWLIVGGILLTIGTIIYRTGEWKGTLGFAVKAMKKKVDALEQKVDKIYDPVFSCRRFACPLREQPTWVV